MIKDITMDVLELSQLYLENGITPTFDLYERDEYLNFGVACDGDISPSFPTAPKTLKEGFSRVLAFLSNASSALAEFDSPSTLESYAL